MDPCRCRSSSACRGEFSAVARLAARVVEHACNGRLLSPPNHDAPGNRDRARFASMAAAGSVACIPCRVSSPDVVSIQRAHSAHCCRELSRGIGAVADQFVRMACYIRVVRR